MTTAEAISQFQKDYDFIGVTIVKLLVDELRDQGHVATGKLLRSVVAATQTMLDGIETSIGHLKYGVDLNTGIPAGRVPRSGTAEYSTLITNLIKWIRFRRIVHGAGKEYRFARNIIRKAQVTGFPTPGAYKFTSNSRRTGWIDFVVNTYQTKWEDKAETAAFNLVDNYIDAKIEEIEARYKGTLN